MRTANVEGAGTDADVEVQLVGSSASTDFMNCDNSGDDRERGNVDIYFLGDVDPDVGVIHQIRVRAREESATPNGPAWKLDRISVLAGAVPPEAIHVLNQGLGDVQARRTAFESLINGLPQTKVFHFSQVIVPGSFAERATDTEWTVVEG